MAKWRFNLRYSKDLALIGELSRASGRSVTLAHNTPGSANWDYPMSADYADIIQPINTCISAERYNWRATLAMNLAGTPGQAWDWIWSGMILPIDEDWTNDTMKISCVGWAHRMAMRQLKRDKSWPGWDDAAVIQDLLAEMNLPNFPDTSNYPVPTVAGSNPATPTWLAIPSGGVTVPNEGPGGATAYVPRTPPFSAYKKTKDQFVLPIWDELTGFENGPDWWVNPKTRELYVARRRCVIHDGTNYPAVTVAFRWGPNNLAQFGRNIAADQKCNYALVTGKAGVTSGFHDNVPDQQVNGLIESLTQWTDADNTEVLKAEAAAQIILRLNGKITYGITPFAYTGDIGQPPTAVPEPFVDYNPIGDIFLLKARHAVRGDIPLGFVRSFGVGVNIDDEGNEVLGQLQVAP